MTIAEEAALLRSQLDLMIGLMADEAAVSNDADQIEQLGVVRQVVVMLKAFDDEALVESFHETKHLMPEALKGIFV